MSESTANVVTETIVDGAGVEGNTLLTSSTGVVLLVMLVVEGYTVLDVRGMITLHVFVGVMLIGPVLLRSPRRCIDSPAITWANKATSAKGRRTSYSA